MNQVINMDNIIMLASDSEAETTQLMSIICREFNHKVSTSTLHNFEKNFYAQKPNILILGFKSVKLSLGSYLKVLRGNRETYLREHKVILLCSKSESDEAYILCKDNYVDDYIIYRPMTYDVNRLLISIRKLTEICNQSRGRPMAPQLLSNGNISSRTSAFDQDISCVIKPVANQQTVRHLVQMDSWQNESHLKNGIVKKCNDKPVLHNTTETSIIKNKKIDYTIHILIIDDDEFFKKYTTELLSEENSQIYTAASYTESLEAMADIMPDIIIIDYNLSRTNGVEAFLRIKNIRKYRNIPIIVATGQSDMHTVKKCIRTGVDDFLVKPFDRDTAVKKVYDLVRKYNPHLPHFAE